MGALKFGDDVLVTHAQGGGAVAEPHLVKIGRVGFPAVGGRHQDLAPFTAFHGDPGR